jgi:hypothetical protein
MPFFILGVQRRGQALSAPELQQNLRVNFGARYFPPVPIWIALVSRASRFQSTTRIAREILTATRLLRMFQTASSQWSDEQRFKNGGAGAPRFGLPPDAAAFGITN